MGQSSQVFCAESLWLLPAGHAGHAVLDGLLAEKKPAEQSVQTPCPPLAAKVPSGQSVQPHAFAPLATLPAAHSVQLFARVPEKKPTSQLKH